MKFFIFFLLIATNVFAQPLEENYRTRHWSAPKGTFNIIRYHLSTFDSLSKTEEVDVARGCFHLQRVLSHLRIAEMILNRGDGPSRFKNDIAKMADGFNSNFSYCLLNRTDLPGKKEFEHLKFVSNKMDDIQKVWSKRDDWTKMLPNTRPGLVLLLQSLNEIPTTSNSKTRRKICRDLAYADLFWLVAAGEYTQWYSDVMISTSGHMVTAAYHDVCSSDLDQDDYYDLYITPMLRDAVNYARQGQ